MAVGTPRRKKLVEETIPTATATRYAPEQVGGYPMIEAALVWAKGVLAGKQRVGRKVIKALERHFRDTERSKDPNYPYFFDPESAERRLMLISKLPHTKGEWAAKGMKINLEPWQSFGLGMIYGWLRKGSGYRRFREAYFEVPRKNGKSVLAAGIGVAMFVADREFGAEVYSGATTQKQAMEVFRPARIMIQKSPELQQAAGIQVNAQTLAVPGNGSRFEPVVGDPGDGASPSCAIIDEFHEHQTSALYDTMLTGMGARRQPLLFIITTAGYLLDGPCYTKRKECLEMLDQTVPDEELFAYIWDLDEEDDWTDPANLAKANPNLGVSVFRDFLESQLAKAVNQPRFAGTFKTKHLNQWTASKAGFFNMVNWNKCEDKTLTLDQFYGNEVNLGLDLARKLDLNSMARLFWRDIDGKRHYYSISPRFWAPYDTIYDVDNKRMAERLQTWLAGGYLESTDGAEVDYRAILAAAVETNEANPVAHAAIDPSGATALSHGLDDEGLTPVTIIQNFQHMSDPMKELEAAIEAGRFHHDGNPIMTFCISNVIGKYLPGNDDVVRPVKESADNKIDGAVALIMAVKMAMAGEKESSVDDFIANMLSV